MGAPAPPSVTISEVALVSRLKSPNVLLVYFWSVLSTHQFRPPVSSPRRLSSPEESEETAHGSVLGISPLDPVVTLGTHNS